MTTRGAAVAAIDLFCGAGGLSLGLQQAGIEVIAGFDLDPACAYPFSHNLGTKFHLRDVTTVTGQELLDLWPRDAVRLLAGCAPCQPFSSQRRGVDTRHEENWDLLAHFGRLVEETEPELVTMENVTRLKGQPVFQDFVAGLRGLGYEVAVTTLYGPDFGLPQERRRLVMMASRVGPVTLPIRNVGDERPTVRRAIGTLPAVEGGEADPEDPLHAARRLSPLNVQRMHASKPGGTWRDWPEELLAPCHRRTSGASFQSFYGRMTWDEPAPTVTTLSYNFGAGRFGHPEQHRTLTLREAAMLQGFPRYYRFVGPDETPARRPIGRLIGNAVPPPFGRAVGSAFLASLG